MNIDISTEEKKEQLYKLFDSFSKIGDIYNHFGLRDTSKNIRYIRDIASLIGFDLSIYKQRKKKYCLHCGKELVSGQKKFCSYSCSAIYNNIKRGPRTEETKNKIKNSLIEKYHRSHKNRKSNSTKTRGVNDIHLCVVCGNPIKYNGRITCCEECLQIHIEKINKSKRDIKYQYYLEHQEEFCKPNYTPKFKKEFIEEQGGVCAICGCKPEWNGKELVFVLDHIDGDASNNRRNNLRCICPNCDSQLDTYKSKNKHSTRRNYWKEKLLREAKDISN